MNGHIANIEVMMTNPVGVGDHPTIVILYKRVICIR